MKLKFRKHKKRKSLFYSWLRYVLIWIVFAAFYVFYQNYITFYCFVLVTSLPWLSLLIMRFHFKSGNITIAFSQGEYEKDKEAKIKIDYRGKNTPFGVYTIQGVILNQFYQTEEPFLLSFFTAPQVHMEQRLSLPTCGGIELSIQQAQLFDVLGMWKKRVPLSLHTQAIVFPIPFVSPAIQQMVQEGSEKERETLRKGNFSYADSYDVREYHDGDSLKNLHHKITFKLNKPMIKEFANLEQALVYLNLDFSGETEEIEQTLALCYSVVLAFVKQQQKVICCWNTTEHNVSFEVENIAQIRLLMRSILSSPLAHLEGELYHVDGANYRLKGYEIKEIAQGVMTYEG